MLETIIIALDLLKKAPEPWGFLLQYNSTIQMEGLKELHNNIMFYLAIILFAVSWMMVSIILNFKNKKITNKHIGNNDLMELILIISPVLILILITFPSFKLLYLMDEVIDPTLIMYGEGYQWYWDYKHTNYIEKEDYKGMTHCMMNIASIINISPWSDNLPDMAQYVSEMKQYKGKTLQEANITLDTSGPRTRLNVITWYFHNRDIASFFAFDVDKTPITDDFLYRAQILPCKTNEEKIPQDFLNKFKVSSLKNLPSNH